MQNIKINCNDLLSAINETIVKVQHVDIPQMPAKNTTLSDTDPNGAVKFTVAVVLLYGVGVIGLLGITARRNRQVQMMDKEVNKFLKCRQYGTPFKRKTKPKTAISKLIRALHSPSKSEGSEFNSDGKSNLLQRSNTWTAGVEAGFHSSRRVTKTVSMSVLDPSKSNNNALLEGNDEYILQGSCSLSSYQELHSVSDNLGRIEEEENNVEYSELNECETELMEVRVVTPRTTLQNAEVQQCVRETQDDNECSETSVMITK